MAKYEKHDYVKEIFWINIETGRHYEGFATYDIEDGIVALRGENWTAFEILEQEDISNGATLKDIFDDIPEDVTEYQLR